MTMPCSLATVEQDQVDNTAHTPPAPPPITLECGSLSKEMEACSSEGDHLRHARIKAGCYGQMQPPIIHLRGHVGFATIPVVERFFTRIRPLGRDVSTSAVLDLSDVRQMETCTARFLAKVASRLVADATPGLLVLVKPINAPGVLTHLIREMTVVLENGSRLDDNLSKGDGLKSNCATGGPKPHSVPVPLVCDSLEEAIITIQNRTCDAQLALSLPWWPSELQRRDPTTVHVQQIIDKLFSCLLQKDLSLEVELSSTASAYACMERAGLVVRHIRRGEPISCSQYPVRHTFMVLQGLVVVESSYAGQPQATPQRPVRKAALSATKEVFRSFEAFLSRWFRPTQRNGRNNRMSAYMRAFDQFAAERLDSHCARASGGFCWILEIDQVNQVGVAAARQLAEHFAATSH